MGTDDAVCVDLRDVGGGYSDRVLGAEAEVLILMGGVGVLHRGGSAK